MGCWSETCVISNLPITYDRIAMLLVSDVGWAQNIVTLPIFGTYNEYGSIEDIDDTPYARYMLQFLKNAIDEDKIDLDLRSAKASCFSHTDFKDLKTITTITRELSIENKELYPVFIIESVWKEFCNADSNKEMYKKRITEIKDFRKNYDEAERLKRLGLLNKKYHLFIENTDAIYWLNESLEFKEDHFDFVMKGEGDELIAQTLQFKHVLIELRKTLQVFPGGYQHDELEPYKKLINITNKIIIEREVEYIQALEDEKNL